MKKLLLLLCLFPAVLFAQHQIPYPTAPIFYGTRHFVSYSTLDTLAIYSAEDTLFLTANRPIYIDSLTNKMGSSSITLTGDVTGTGTENISTTIGVEKVHGTMFAYDVISDQTYTNIVERNDKVLIDNTNNLYYIRAHDIKKYVTAITDIRTSTLTVSNSTTATTVFSSTIDRNDLQVGRVFEIYLTASTQIYTAGKQVTILLNMGGTKVYTLYGVAQTSPHAWKTILHWKGVVRSSTEICSSVEGQLADNLVLNTGQLTPINSSTDLLVTITFQLNESNTNTKFSIYQAGIRILN